MKYSDLIDPNYSIPVDSEVHEKYEIIKQFASADIVSYTYFCSWKIARNQAAKKAIGTNWKARLSIHPDDIGKAWEIIYPFFSQKDISFKVADIQVVEQFKKNRQNKLEKLIAEYRQFLQHAHSQSRTSLQNNFHRLYQQLAAYEQRKKQFGFFRQTYSTQLTSFFYKYTLSREDLLTRTKNIYERLIEKRKQSVKNSLRLYEGMQFTIYMLPGFEKDHQNTLEEIEYLLLQANIRPGKTFSTDRQIGIYSSIRHPGKWYYHNATDADLETYNPDNLNDPFGFLKTIPTTQIMQESELQAILKNKASSKMILSALQAKQFIAPSQFKALAMRKENVVQHIKTLPLGTREALITDCLDKSSNLGRFFRVKRGIFNPKLGHGTLKQLEDIQLTIS